MKQIKTNTDEARLVPRCCETCKHVGKGPTDLPCSICDDTTEWEETTP